MASPSSSNVDSLNSSSRLPTSAPSSPPQADDFDNAKMALTSTFTEQQMLTEEKKAKAENTRAEAKRLAQRRKRKVQLSPQERARKAKELDELLRKSKIFSDILTQKTKALGRVGRDFDNRALTDAGLELKQQPKIMSGGTMRDYQLEGLTWMYEICLQGLSGILADEMGLGSCSSCHFTRIVFHKLTEHRKNYPGYFPSRIAQRAGELLRPSPSNCTVKYLVELAG